MTTSAIDERIAQLEAENARLGAQIRNFTPKPAPSPEALATIACSECARVALQRRGFCRKCDQTFAAQGNCPQCGEGLREQMRIGYCGPCKRFHETDGDCHLCGRGINVRLECMLQIQVDYGKALLAVQPFMNKDDSPELYERQNERMNWSAPTNPMFLGNAGIPMVRKATAALRGVAAQHGIYLGDGPQAGTEIAIEMNGEPWIAWQDTRTGTLRPLRRVEVDSTLTSIPEGFPGTTYDCPDCGAKFSRKFALVGHSRTHGR